ncbi:hypothetical protein ACE01N_05725 [Saccharicrinis sp. FJH2]|uniref:hypothetical protein n=1 Tax=Saccharicrinis sp. FJH65 TaxID=3344659 RepID=UPI0035F2B795
MDRKAFLQRLGRLSLLGGLAAVSGLILTKREISAEKCAINEVCKNCNEYRFCSKDQALKQRVNERKQKD